MEFVVTAEQKAEFRRNGFIALQAITSPEEVAWLRDIYDRLFATQSGFAAGDKLDLVEKGGGKPMGQGALPQILHPAKYAPELAGAQFRGNAHALARALLGPQAEFQGEHAILKPPRSGAPTPWHQDEAYWDPALEYESLSVWMPLQEATLENGCMQFVPGTHGEVWPHHHIGNDPTVVGLEADSADASAAVACPIPAGGATVHHCRTLHYTGPNRSDAPRRAYILVFRLPTKRRAVPRDFYWNAPA